MGFIAFLWHLLGFFPVPGFCLCPPVSPCVPCVPSVLCIPCVSLCPLYPLVSLLSPFVPCVPCFLLCPLVSPVSPCVSLCPLVSLVSPCVPWVALCPLCLLCSLCPLKFMAALPLFLLLPENFDGFHFFHITCCGFFYTPRRSKDVIRHEKKNSKHKVLLDLFRK